LEPVNRVVTKRGKPVHLTRKEFDVLYCLMIRRGQVVTYANLRTGVWGADSREEIEYLRTFVRQLRKKIEDDPSNPFFCSQKSTSDTVLRSPRMFYESEMAMHRGVYWSPMKPPWSEP
jgi:hypothetical protein